MENKTKQKPNASKTSNREIVLTMLLHDREELDDHLGGRTDHHLALASLLGVVDGVERIVENGSPDHFDGFEILKSSDRGVVV